MLSKDEQLHLALLIGSFQFLDNLVFPGQVLRSRLKSETNINSAQTEEIVLTLLVATCCKHDGLIAGEFNQISSVIEDKLLKNFDSLNHSELAVCYQGLKAISVSGGAKLGSKMETVYGFRM